MIKEDSLQEGRERASEAGMSQSEFDRQHKKFEQPADNPFNLSDIQLKQLLDKCLKPEEIAGEQGKQFDRVRELIGWFLRYATDQHANSKWFQSHAFEMVYYIATNSVNRSIDNDAERLKAYYEGVNITPQERAVMKKLFPDKINDSKAQEINPVLSVPGWEEGYDPIGCTHKIKKGLLAGLTSFQFFSEESGSGPDFSHCVSTYVCPYCGAIMRVGHRATETNVNSFNEVFDLSHQDAVEAIVRNCNYMNRETEDYIPFVRASHLISAPVKEQAEQDDKYHPQDYSGKNASPAKDA